MSRLVSSIQTVSRKTVVCYLLMLFALVALPTGASADVNVLIIGSTTDTATELGFTSATSKPFTPTQIKAELQNILNGADLGTVNVTLEDRSTTSYDAVNLTTWFHYPYPANVETTTRWPNLRGENGTPWDYVILIEDPYTIEYLPGLYTHGVAMVADEVAKSSLSKKPETVLLMPWPSTNSSSTVAHYKEIVYRTGNTTGCKVAPAALAWEAAGSPRGATHPDNNGAYIAAATIYSTLWGQSAAASSYNPNSALANTAHTTVTSNAGIQQYTGVYNGAGPFQFRHDKQRSWENEGTSKSSDQNMKSALNGLVAENRMSATVGDRAVWASWADYTAGYPMCFYFAYPSNDNGLPADEFIGLMWSDIANSENIRLERITTSSLRYLPNRVIWAQYHKLYPSAAPIIGQHYAYSRSGAALNYTLFSGRCPLGPKPNPVDSNWNQVKLGYETAWRLGRCQGRAPGFRTLPSSAARLKMAPGQTETLTVQFVLPLQSNVTVNVSVANTNVASVSPSQLTFTPANYTNDHQVVVTCLGNPDASALIRVDFNTVSTDEICNGLNDSWDYTRSFSPVITQSPWVDVNPITLPAKAWVNVTASDPEGDTRTYTWSKVSGPGTATFSPNSGTTSQRSEVTFSKPGTYVLKVMVSDGTSSTDGGEVTVQVLNAVPVANPQSVIAFQGSPQPITLMGTDASGDPLTYVVWDDPLHGTLTGTGANLVYTSESGYLGSDSFTFLVNDGYGNSSPATVSITVNAPNTPPVVNAGPDQVVPLVGTPPTIGWSFAPWTGDADSGITSASTYTAAHSFGNNRASAVVNGVTFSESNVASGTGWSIGGAATFWNGDDNAAVTGNSELLAQEFVYAANPRTVTFTGLTVGETYEASFFSVAWETGARTQTFSTPGVTSMNINQDQYGDNQGIRITCVYTATSATQVITITPLISASTLHLYALANKVLRTFSATVSLAGSANDAEGDSLTNTWSRTSGPGSVVFGNASALATTATFDQTGTYLLKLTAADAYSQVFDELTVTVTDLSGNSAPAAVSAFITTGENIAKAVTLTAFDAQSDVLTYSIVTPPAHGALSGTAPDLTYTPTAGYSGSDSFTFKVNDGVYDSALATVSITVISNQTPVIVVDSPTTNAPHLGPYGGVIVETTVTDDGYPLVPGAVTLNWSKISGPGTVTFESPTQADTAIEFSAAGTYVVRLTASDGTKQATRDITLLFSSYPTDGSNQGPQVSAQPNVSGQPGVPVPLLDDAIYLGDDGKPFDTLTSRWQILSGPGAGAFADPAVKATTFVCNAPGTYVLRLIADDGQVKAFDDLTVTISGTGNLMPVANAQTVSVTEDTPKAITLSGSDGNSNPLTYAIVTPPAHGTLSGAAPNVTYTPAANYNGSDSFTFKVNDGITDSLTAAAVSITVNPVNDAPVAHAMSVTTFEDMRLPITLDGSEADGDALTFSIVTQPAHGTVSGSGAGVKYTPAPAFNGNDSFTFRVTDPSGLFSEAVVSIAVTAVQNVPVANPQSVNAEESTPKLIVLTGTDADNDSLTYSIFAQPLHGTLDTNNLPNVIYTSDANYFGTDFFTFTVNDGKDASIVATVSITVQPVGLSSVDIIRGLSQSYPLGYFANANSTDVGGTGTLGYRSVQDVVHGHGLPILPPGAVVTSATLKYEVTGLNLVSSHRLDVYLLDTANPDSTGTSFFYIGPSNTTDTAKFISSVNGIGAKQIALDRTSVEILRSYYGGDHIPDRLEAFFRFNLNTAIAAGSLVRYAIGTSASQNSLELQYVVNPNYYSVTYNGNGNTGGTAPSNQVKIQTVPLDISLNSGTLVKSGYSYMGWNTAADGSGTDYAVGTLYATEADLTLYAKWSTPPVVNTGTNQTVLMVMASATGWSFAPWTGDADSGISSSYAYTAKHSFGNNRASATVNGVTFSEGNVASGTGWSIGGTAAYWNGDDDAAVSGNSELLAQEFVYNGNPRTVTFTGLTVGQTYEASFFSVAWETGSRIQTFSTPGVTSADINQDQYGDNQGIRISCSYTATATSQTVTIGLGFHMYAIANRVVPSLSATVSLDGTASDADGDPLTTAWSVVSPTNSGVIFGNAAMTNTTATFTNAGSYVLLLTANDTYTQVMSQVMITVVSSSAVTTNHSVPHVWLATQNPAWASDYDAAVTNDADSDGFTTWQEYWSGTDPQNSNSFMRIDSISVEGGNIVIKWENAAVGAGVPPLSILATTNLISGAWSNVGQVTIVNGVNAWSNSAVQQLYYRLAVTNAP